MTRRRSATGATLGARSAIALVVVPSNDRISIASFGVTGASGTRFRNAPSPTLGRPLLAGAEVVDVSENDVAHRRPVGNREREREERDPALRVHRSVDRIDDHDSRPPASELARPELLGDEHEALPGRLEARDDRVLGRLVDRGRVVAALATTKDRLALARVGSRSSTALMSATQRRQVSSQAVMPRSGGRGARTAASGRSRCSSEASARRAARWRTHRRLAARAG